MNLWFWLINIKMKVAEMSVHSRLSVGEAEAAPELAPPTLSGLMTKWSITD